MQGVVADTVVHFFYLLDLWLLFSLVGLLASSLWLIPATLRARQIVCQRWHRAWWMTLGLLLANSVVIFYMDISIQMEMPDAHLPAVCSSILVRTHYGQMTGLRWAVLASLVIWVVCLRHRVPGPVAGIFALLLKSVLVFTLSATSHASSQGIVSTTLLVHWFHLVAAMIWGGVILGFCSQVNPLLSPEHLTVKQVGSAVGRMSRVATAIFLFALATGLILACSLIGEWHMLFETEYSRRMLIKLIFVALLLGVALKLRLTILPELGAMAMEPEKAPISVERLKRWLVYDRALVALILLMASDVAHQVPPVDLVYGPGNQG